MASVLLLLEPNDEARARITAVLRRKGVIVKAFSDVTGMLGAIESGGTAAERSIACAAGQLPRIQSAANRQGVAVQSYSRRQVADRALVTEWVASIETSLRGQPTGRRAQRLNRSKPLDLLLIGSSTGGIPVVERLLRGLRLKHSIVVVCQHVAESNTDKVIQCFAKGLRDSPHLISGTERLTPGKIYVLEGGQDYRFRQRGSLIIVDPATSPSHYHPAVDALVQSASRLKGVVFGVTIVSGIADDGAKYLPEAKASGAHIWVQEPSEASAPGMPTAALATGAVDETGTTEVLQQMLRRRLT